MRCRPPPPSAQSLTTGCREATATGTMVHASMGPCFMYVGDRPANLVKECYACSTVRTHAAAVRCLAGVECSSCASAHGQSNGLNDDFMMSTDSPEHMSKRACHATRVHTSHAHAPNHLYISTCTPAAAHAQGYLVWDVRSPNSRTAWSCAHGLHSLPADTKGILP